MHDNVGNPITVDEMARTAMFSKFHFCRLFQKVTGVSPGRFLAALRFQRAKHLLVSTSLSVTDISGRVGYTSVGTFSSRFSSSVGISPSTYRRLGGVIPRVHIEPTPDLSTPAPSALEGEVHPPADAAVGKVFVGLFPDRIQLGRPARCTLLPGPGSFRLGNVPPGRWYILAHAAFLDGRRGAPGSTQSLSVGSFGPLVVTRPGSAGNVLIQLRPMQPFDPPVVHALVDDPSLPHAS
ncbi:helix-turn-helix domain-containing protein [Micromonospora chersina]|uniref:helix-turn-helix domain-containing protein n=1 Tax=Micromonospora chersina TaxID=47854 RepID=UPI003F53F690